MKGYIGALVVCCGMVLMQLPCVAVALTVEVKELNGAPALFINGEPHTGLMFWTVKPIGKAVVRNGRLELSGRGGSQRVKSRPLKHNRFIIEATAVMQVGYINDATIGVMAVQDDRSCYYLGLGYFHDGNRVKLWKGTPQTGWQCWFTPKWEWKLNQPHQLRLVVDGNRIRGYVDGKLVAEKIDKRPLKPTRITLSAYQCGGYFENVRILTPDGDVLLSDDFDRFNRGNWEALNSAWQRLGAFARSGVHLYSFGVPLGWVGEGKYDYTFVDQLLAGVLEIDPQALIIPRIGVDAPRWWHKLHPEELNVVWRDGKLGTWGRQSFSSQKWLHDAGEALRNFVRHIENSKFGEHVIGYHICAGASSEWSYCWGGEFYDYSKPHLEAFRKWLRKRYGDVEKLRKAWRDEKVTFETATIPSGERRMRGDLFEFFDPAVSRQVCDYLEFHNHAMAEAILHFARIVKRETKGKKLVGVFYGYHFFGNAAPWFECGHRAFAKVLNSPDIDFISAPHNYRERQVGGCNLPQTVAGSIRIHGKLYYDEDDTRTALSPVTADFGRASTIEESIELLKRNFASAITKGGTLWWMEQSEGWFNHPKIMATIARLQEIAKHLLRKDRRSAAEIAVIVSDQTAYYLRHSESLIEPLVCAQMTEQMTRIGAPFDCFVADDLPLLRDYKLYIFLNTLYLSDEQRRIIRERILRNGHTVLWMFAPGFVTERGLSVDAISQLIGIRIRMDELGGRPSLTLTDLNHPITRGLPPGLRFGVREPIGPLFYCDDPSARILGELYVYPALNRNWGWARGMLTMPALAVKDMGDWISIWCGVPNMPACLLRNIAKFAGVHIYTEGDDVVYANNSLLAIHARYSGKRMVHLPKRYTVVDAFTGEILAKDAQSFEVMLNRGQTGLWLLER